MARNVELKRKLHSLIEDYSEISLMQHLVRATVSGGYNNPEFVSNEALNEVLGDYLDLLQIEDSFEFNGEGE